MGRARPGIELPEEGLDLDGGPVGPRRVAHGFRYSNIARWTAWLKQQRRAGVLLVSKAEQRRYALGFGPLE